MLANGCVELALPVKSPGSLVQGLRFAAQGV